MPAKIPFVTTRLASRYDQDASRCSFARLLSLSPRGGRKKKKKNTLAGKQKHVYVASERVKGKIAFQTQMFVGWEKRSEAG